MNIWRFVIVMSRRLVVPLLPLLLAEGCVDGPSDPVDMEVRNEDQPIQPSVFAWAVNTDTLIYGSAGQVVRHSRPMPNGRLEELPELPLGWSSTVSSDARAYVVRSIEDGIGLFVIDLLQNSVVDSSGTIPNANSSSDVIVSPVGDHVYVCDPTFGVFVIETATLAVVSEIPVDGNPWDIAVSPDGTRLFVTHSYGAMSVVETVSNTIVETVRLGYRYLSDIDLSPDGTTMFVASSDSEYEFGLFSVDAHTYEIVNVIPGTYKAVRVSPDGTVLAYAGRIGIGQFVYLADAADYELIGAVSIDCSIQTLEFTPDSRFVYFGCMYDGLGVVEVSTATLFARNHTERKRYRKLASAVLPTNVVSIDSILGSGAVNTYALGYGPLQHVCPPHCSEDFLPFETVHLGAIPEWGWTFVEWSGSCSGFPAGCELEMGQDRQASVAFRMRTPYELITGSGFSGGDSTSMIMPWVETHHAEGELTDAQATTLNSLLTAALRSIANDKLGAVGQLRAFIYQVEGLVRKGVLEPGDAQARIDLANLAIEQLQT